jgi:hypothetical protein
LRRASKQDSNLARQQQPSVELSGANRKNHENNSPVQVFAIQISLCTALVLAAGCATDDKTASNTSANSSGSAAQTGSSSPSSGGMNYKATDGRMISIGSCKASDGGRTFKEPHMEKCWIADGFNFKGYDVIYIAPVTSTAKLHDDEVAVQKIAEDNLQMILRRKFSELGFYGKVVTDESVIKPGAKVLKVSNTIVEYGKGGGGARFFVGLYGAGQPKLKVDGQMTDGDKTVFTYTMRRSGVSASARMGGGTMKDEDIQMQDIESLALDLTDFMAAIAGKYTPAN